MAEVPVDVSPAAIAIVAVVLLLARRVVRGPLVGRLRALVPSWRFFDRATLSPRLLIRHAGTAAELGAWLPVDEIARRTPGAIRWAFAPVDNLALAYQAVVEQLVAELGELELEDDGGRDNEPEVDPRVVGLVSYELVHRIARAHAPADAVFQWKIVVPDARGPIDYLLSPIAAPGSAP